LKTNFLSLYFHTLRYLEPVQIWGRLASRLATVAPDRRPAPGLRSLGGLWQPPACREVSLLAPGRFRFLNRECSPGTADPDPPVSRLWLYNLHYFDDLNAAAAAERRAWHRSWIETWIVENPFGEGPGWEPYPLSLRIVNWIKWALAGNSIGAAAEFSLAMQVRYLCRRLEYHLRANHLFANAKALVFAGCFFEGPEAESWLRIGMGIMQREMPEQILPDGGHFERSPMYHALAFEDMVDILNLSHAFPSALAQWTGEIAGWPATTTAMGRWLAAMCHPDGEISFFNDAAIGIAPTPVVLFDYARRVGIAVDTHFADGALWLRDSGYIRVQNGEAVLLIDVAPVGPDYQPGHAHADTLSFELSLRNQRVVVNAGTSTYEAGYDRTWERSTAAHNTVEIDGENSSETWASFRVARRARPFDITVDVDGDEIVVSAAHDGYRRLAGRSVHWRCWRIGVGYLRIEDRIDGAFRTAVSRLHFHPAIRSEADTNIGTAHWAGGTMAWHATHCASTLSSYDYSSEFGLRQPASCLELMAAQGNFSLECRWA
jgi:uncharacterized heparinase superfamily protein